MKERNSAKSTEPKRPKRQTQSARTWKAKYFESVKYTRDTEQKYWPTKNPTAFQIPDHPMCHHTIRRTPKTAEPHPYIAN